MCTRPIIISGSVPAPSLSLLAKKKNSGCSFDWREGGFEETKKNAQIKNKICLFRERKRKEESEKEKGRKERRKGRKERNT